MCTFALGCPSIFSATRPRGYKTYPMLNSAEHEILLANKQQMTDKQSCFLAQFSENKIFCAFEYENANISWQFHIYQQRKFHAQLS